MSPEPRVVLDTNVMVSALLRPRSVPRQAYDLSVTKSQMLVSEATLQEVQEVIHRPKFHKYVTQEQRSEFLAALVRDAVAVSVLEVVRACRDPKDDKFLELSIAGSATHLVTGDADLLTLHPFRGVNIVTPQHFLELFTSTSDPVESEGVLRFPFYVIATPHGEVVLAEREGRTPCILGYATKELAELYVQEASDASLVIREVSNERAADSLARAVSSLSQTMIWNTTRHPQWICFMDLSQFIIGHSHS
jgi:putative PIN family toxin of toxin-antitoxin system